MPKEDTKTPPETASGKKRILIVEDERPLAHALELKMNHEGYETHVATTGQEGLIEAQSGKYDLILLDLILPGVDGFAILEAMKGEKKPVIIVLSNLGQDEDRKKAADFGAKDYLVKSNVPLADIVKVVKASI